MKPLPTDAPLLTYYGDDFTGSTDALEALAIQGVSTVLFLGIPDEQVFARFGACRAIGLAGSSRSQSPEWMRDHLPGAFRWLQAQGAPLCQYKVCSTFDSSPVIGSIGRALEIGQDIFQTRYVPVIVGAPHLRRFVAFGNLFAGAGDAIYRIDRHPTMRQHPVTPMAEGDLRLHLGRQTSQNIAALDLVALSNGDAATWLRDHASGAVVFDGVDAASMRRASGLVWESGAAFVVGSSGFTHALIDYWRYTGGFPAAPAVEAAAAVDRVVVVSGSCSPVTERQIRCVLRNGFEGVALDPSAAEYQPAMDRALRHLREGRSVVLYSALGPDGVTEQVDREDLGCRMGILLRDLLRRSGVKRAVVAGGDTSSHAGRQLGVHALTFAAPVAPGSPLCRAHSDDPALQGLELIFKGGQVGRDDFFESVMRGRV